MPTTYQNYKRCSGSQLLPDLRNGIIDMASRRTGVSPVSHSLHRHYFILSV